MYVITSLCQHLLSGFYDKGLIPSGLGAPSSGVISLCINFEALQSLQVFFVEHTLLSENLSCGLQWSQPQ